MIAAASVLSVGFMAYHPTIHSRDPLDFIEAVGRTALVNGIVHGSLIALLAILFCGFTCLASRLGLHSLTVRAGLIAYGIGLIAMVAAATLNGFILTEFVAQHRVRSSTETEAPKQVSPQAHATPHTPASAEETLRTMRHILAYGHAANQVCSRIGVMGVSTAIVLWSLMLLRRTGHSRIIGILGGLAGTALIVALLCGFLPMNVHGMLAFVATQTVWSLVVAVAMIRNHL